MNSSSLKTALRLLIQGAALFALRLAQDRTGFDPETGLALRSWPGTALAVLLVLCAAAELVLCRKLPRGKRSSRSVFDPPAGAPLCGMALGALLLAAGGALLALRDPGSAVAAVCGVSAVCAGLGLIVHVRLLRREGGELSVIPLLPAMVFAVFFLLNVYLPRSGDPVLARYYLPVLAAALAACAISRISAFVRRDATVPGFVFTARMAALTCLAALADAITEGDAPLALLYLGCAAALTAFDCARRETPLDEPVPETGEKKRG